MSSISSNFNSDADGWTMYGDAKSSGWHKKGGHPGGYFGWVDSASGSGAAYAAPAKFLGSKDDYYGGKISYDIFASGNDKPTDPNVLLSDGTHILLGFTSATVGTSWTHETIKLDTSGGWIDYGTNQPASKAEIQTVLDHLSIFYIRAEFVSGKETGGLDNVTMSNKGHAAPAPAPAVFHASDGHAAAGHPEIGHLAALEYVHLPIV